MGEQILGVGSSWRLNVVFLCLKANAQMVPQDSQVATACFSRGPPDLYLLDPYFIFMYMHNLLAPELFF